MKLLSYKLSIVIILLLSSFNMFPKEIAKETSEKTYYYVFYYTHKGDTYDKLTFVTSEVFEFRRLITESDVEYQWGQLLIMEDLTRHKTQGGTYLYPFDSREKAEKDLRESIVRYKKDGYEIVRIPFNYY